MDRASQVGWVCEIPSLFDLQFSDALDIVGRTWLHCSVRPLFGLPELAVDGGQEAIDFGSLGFKLLFGFHLSTLDIFIEGGDGLWMEDEIA